MDILSRLMFTFVFIALIGFGCGGASIELLPRQWLSLLGGGLVGIGGLGVTAVIFIAIWTL